jgi:ATP-binding cassette subfamily A (ABC1) protein 3
LCTRIGIMSRGNLRCLGTNVHLKNKFGEGYSLKVNFDPENADVVTGNYPKLLIV